MPLIFLVEVLIFGPQIHAYSEARQTAPSLSFGFSVFLEKSIQNWNKQTKKPKKKKKKNYLAAAAAKSLQSCPTLCDPMDCRPPGSSVHGIFQARVLEWGKTILSVLFIGTE